MRSVNVSPLGHQQARNVATPNHALPSIHQRRVSVKEPSVHTLEEDDYFGGSPLKKRVKEQPLFAPIPPKRQAEKEQEQEPAPDTKNMNAQEISIAQQIKEQKMQLEFEKQKQQTDKALREKKGLQQTIDTMKKTFKIEMKQAKTKAKEMFEEMLRERL